MKQFINSGEINLTIESVLETCHLALYLHLECLQQICLDHFTYNLNRKSLESQLRTMEKHLFVDEEFKKRALRFKESGRPSFSGLYFLQRVDRWTISLKMFSNYPDYAHVISIFEMKDFSPLHFFDNMICMVEYSWDLH